MNHEGHDHTGHQMHDHSGHHMNHDPATTTATIVQKIVENVTEAVQSVIKTTTVNPHAGHQMNGHEHHGHHMASNDVPASDIHNNHGHGGHDMKMWFHGGHNEVILFDFWRINSCTGLIISCLLIFFMGAAYEGIKWFRIYLQLKDTKRVQRSRVVMPNAAIVKNGSNPSSPEKIVITLPQNSHNEQLLTTNNDDNQVYHPTVKRSEADSASVG